ncbi:Plasmodium exported protein, unknown function [Plasmodium sp. gorilla clade G2]|uniref:Plasmodium exported protein, unknown function n=1 Tax=Plasmodium sp. gorilla clade G2 TaxID=880535 RepID=UPI000D269925|nr:Plasmodium exported protein, unknown function [Plasmodium sp. gorilla clade G2]SOV20314.1 Plasmodium exported protein, unknown function [Plasmodium sp. gorilla clade G2]
MNNQHLIYKAVLINYFPKEKGKKYFFLINIIVYCILTVLYEIFPVITFPNYTFVNSNDIVIHNKRVIRSLYEEYHFNTIKDKALINDLIKDDLIKNDLKEDHIKKSDIQEEDLKNYESFKYNLMKNEEKQDNLTKEDITVNSSNNNNIIIYNQYEENMIVDYWQEENIIPDFPYEENIIINNSRDDYLIEEGINENPPIIVDLNNSMINERNVVDNEKDKVKMIIYSYIKKMDLCKKDINYKTFGKCRYEEDERK